MSPSSLKQLTLLKIALNQLYKGGKSVNDLIDGLRNSTIKADDLPPIRIFERNGQSFSLDNRRLYDFREANIPVRTQQATPA